MISSPQDTFHLFISPLLVNILAGRPRINDKEQCSSTLSHKIAVMDMTKLRYALQQNLRSLGL